jgi:hypothetical protein
MSAARRTGSVLLGFTAMVLALWGAMALHFAGPRPAALADVLAAGLVVVTIAIVGWVRPFGRTLVALVVLAAVFSLWWSSLTARNDRQWQTDVAELPTAALDGDRLTIHNLRNFDYRTETDYTPRWETRTYDLAKLEGLDLFMSYWDSPSIAHTIMSWSFTDGQHLAVSIETRKEVGEVYSTFAGFFRQYEIYYVVADERDVIRLRTNYRNPHEQVHLYQMRTPVSRARRILLDYVASINALAEKAQFYNAATSNCTTSITQHIRKIGLRFPFDRRVLINGRLDELLYEHGIVDTSLPFPALRQATLVNARAEAADQDPAFATRIREGLTRPPLLVLPPGTE